MDTRILVLFLWFVPFACGFAQSNLNTFYQDYLDKKRTNDAFFKNIEGSPYENEDFIEAEVFLKGNDASRKFLLRYNNLTDQMEMKKSSDEDYLVVDNMDLIDSIFMNHELFLYRDFIQDKKPAKGFFVRLVAGKLTLLQRRMKEFIPERKPTGGYQEYVKPSFQLKPTNYYLVFEKGVPELLPETMPGIVRFLKKKGYDISELVKQNKLKHKKEDIIELIRLINRL